MAHRNRCVLMIYIDFPIKNCPLSMAMLNNQRVNHEKTYPEVTPRPSDLLSSKTVFRFSIQIASIGPSPAAPEKIVLVVKENT